jgi:hypothetical protein
MYRLILKNQPDFSAGRSNMDKATLLVVSRTYQSMSRHGSVESLLIGNLSTLALKFGDVFHSGCLAEGFFMRVDLGEQRFQVLAAELLSVTATGDLRYHMKTPCDVAT